MGSVPPPPYLANFDSASAMLRAVAHTLAGRQFRTLGVDSPLEVVAPILPHLPDRVLEQLYIRSGASEAAEPRQMREVSAERLSRWAVGEYPPRQFPAAFVGSSNGALVHLAVATGAAFLPQTFLVPVRRRGFIPMTPSRTRSGAGSRVASCWTRTPSSSCTTCTTPTRTA